MVETLLSIDCNSVVLKVSNFIDDDLDPVLRARMMAHFATCTRCTAILDGTRNIIRLVGDGTVFQVPPHVSANLYRKLEEYLKTRR